MYNTPVAVLLLLFGTTLEMKVTWVPSYNYGPRINKEMNRTVTTPTILVLHYTADTLEEAIEIFQTNGTVSSHYTVAKNGSVYQHVEEKYRAWHAGEGSWGIVKDVNTYSVGIEIENLGYRVSQTQPPGIRVPGSNYEWYPFTEAQMKSVIKLSSEIVKRYGIKPRNVIGHADLAPGRKQDPGPLFPWKQLAEKGVGAWVDHHTPDNETDVKKVQEKLRRYGYTQVPNNGQYDNATQQGLVSFQMHFRPENISGQIDAETVGILNALLSNCM